MNVKDRAVARRTPRPAIIFFIFIFIVQDPTSAKQREEFLVDVRRKKQALARRKQRCDSTFSFATEAVSPSSSSSSPPFSSQR
jgi:hypothetical protein